MKGTSGTNTNSIAGVQNNSGSNQRYDFRGKPNDDDINTCWIGKLTLTEILIRQQLICLLSTDFINSTGVAYLNKIKPVDSHYVEL
jgi:hypothetical protein